ncbi:MAG TPA: hypothetical protein VFO34_01630 [Candidatus Acidoferrales bacterium]|nr:hypothetical protein [Candidatus Acidoferrales bacterium]
MSTTAVVIVVVAIVVVAAVVIFAMLRRRTEHLKSKFGTEYEREVKESGSARRAEQRLESREKRVDKFHIRPLGDADQKRFVERWRAVQAKFVDDPKGAVSDADRLINEVMNARGYPVSNFETAAADLSVNHARVVENYRAAHEIALRHSRGQASTEDLRQAMVYYRSLFEELVGQPPVARAAATGR